MQSSSIGDYQNLLKEYKELSKVNETLADKFFISQIERIHDLLFEKDKIIEEKDIRLKEKDLNTNRIIEENDIRLKEIELSNYKLIKEKDIRLKEKDAHILVAKGW